MVEVSQGLLPHLNQLGGAVLSEALRLCQHKAIPSDSRDHDSGMVRRTANSPAILLLPSLEIRPVPVVYGPFSCNTPATVMGYVKTLLTCLTDLSESIEGKSRVKKRVSQFANDTAWSYGCSAVRMGSEKNQVVLIDSLGIPSNSLIRLPLLRS